MMFWGKGVRVHLLHFGVFLFLLGGVRSCYNKFETVYYFKSAVCDFFATDGTKRNSKSNRGGVRIDYPMHPNSLFNL